MNGRGIVRWKTKTQSWKRKGLWVFLFSPPLSLSLSLLVPCVASSLLETLSNTQTEKGEGGDRAKVERESDEGGVSARGGAH